MKKQTSRTTLKSIGPVDGTGAPRWQHKGAQTFFGSWLPGYGEVGNRQHHDADPYDAALREGANRLATHAGIDLRCSPFASKAGHMFREAALLIDMLHERQRAKAEAADAARKARKAQRGKAARS